MRVPAVFATHIDDGDGGRLLACDRWFGRLGSGGSTVPFSEAAASVPRGDVREPVVVVDADSLSSGGFTEGVVKGMRVRGCDIWFMTLIQDADDLFDAFNTVADRVLAPVRAVGSDDDLNDILSVSDSFVPVVEVSGGRDLWRRSRPVDAVYRLMDIGFYEICVLDVDGSVDGNEWYRIAEACPSAMGFSRDPAAPEEAGIRTVVAPLPLPAPRGRSGGPRRRRPPTPCGRCPGT